MSFLNPFESHASALQSEQSAAQIHAQEIIRLTEAAAKTARMVTLVVGQENRFV